MNIYLLERIGPTDYDELAGLVVIAANGSSARHLALTSEHHWVQEQKEYFDPDLWHKDVDLWIDPNRSTCKLLGTALYVEERPRIVLEDYRAG